MGHKSIVPHINYLTTKKLKTKKTNRQATMAKTTMIKRKSAPMGLFLVLFMILFLIASCFTGSYISGYQSSEFSEAEFDCFTVIVGKEASKDGSVLLAHNEDDSGDAAIRMHVVPRLIHEPGEKIQLKGGGTLKQAKVTNACLWSEMPGFNYSDCYLNEYGVAITSNACPSRESNPSLEDGGIGYYLRKIVAERARTAEEGVHLIGELVESFGYADSGRTYVVADPEEAWIIAVVWGKHWVAQRVPDDHVAVVSNRYSLRGIDFSSPAFAGSNDLIEHAENSGWYSSSGSFDFGKAYGNETSQNRIGNTLRQLAGLGILTGKSFPLDDLPFSTKPDHKISISELFSLLRYHYEGTPYDLTQGYETGSPHQTEFRTICTNTTQASWVMQLRDYMPEWVGNVWWFAMSRPCESVYVPWYSGMLEFPDEYTTIDNWSGEMSAYWVFRSLGNWAENDYSRRTAELRRVWNECEHRFIQDQQHVEREALKIFREKGVETARKYLTKYSRETGIDVLNRATSMIEPRPFCMLCSW
jgi:dipeptidase